MALSGNSVPRACRPAVSPRSRPHRPLTPHAAALLFLAAATISGQPSNNSAPIIQPGAPGNASKILTPATAAAPPRVPAEADISFMQGMIHHHSQAVEMVDLLRTRSRNKRLQAFGKRITISQSDEIKFMAK